MTEVKDKRKCPKCSHEHLEGMFCFGCANDAETDDAYKYISCNWKGGSTNYDEFWGFNN